MIESVIKLSDDDEITKFHKISFVNYFVMYIQEASSK